MFNFRYSILFLVFIILVIKPLSGQLIQIADPSGTTVTEINPTFTCGYNYDNVPIARSTGKTWRFENANWPNNIFWGLSDLIPSLITAGDPTCANLDSVFFDIDSSNLAGGVAVFNGPSQFPVLGSTPIRITFTANLFPTGGQIAFSTSFAGKILIPITADFQVNVLIEAEVETGDPRVTSIDTDTCHKGGIIYPGWYPAVDLFDSIGCAGNNCKTASDVICTSFDRPPFYENCVAPDLPTCIGPTDTLCPNSDAEITIIGDLESASRWVIYTGSCGGDSLDMTTTSTWTIQDLNTTKTFYIRGMGGCIAPGSCDSITIHIMEDTLYLSAADLSGDPHPASFWAAKVIISDGTITGVNSENVEFKAGEDIILLPNFTVESGAIFKATLEACSPIELLVRKKIFYFESSDKRYFISEKNLIK